MKWTTNQNMFSILEFSQVMLSKGQKCPARIIPYRNRTAQCQNTMQGLEEKNTAPIFNVFYEWWSEIYRSETTCFSLKTKLIKNVVFFSIAVTSKQFFGDPIECDPGHAKVDGAALGKIFQQTKIVQILELCLIYENKFFLIRGGGV